MANLRDIRKRRKGAQNTRKITRTMELVASAKLKKAQDAAAASRPYAEGLRELVATISAASGGGAKHPLMAKRPVNWVTILVATADRGLAGAFNANLVNVAMRRAKEHEAKGRKVTFISLGKKANAMLTFLGRTPTAAYTGVVGKTTFARAEEIAVEAMKAYNASEADLVEVVYARFISAARQVPDFYVMLPAGGQPEDGEGAAKAAAEAKPRAYFIYEPEPAELLATLIPRTVKVALFSALLQTTAGEHAARRVAMKNATDAAADMVKSLSSVYNRGRQGKITQEIAEIVGAVEAMA
jgi:F-type H+-transporting ATPase subunit gamma